MTILGKYFPPGTVLSVPTYSIHRDKEIWGEDVESFRPERWVEGGDGDVSLMQKAFNPFSFGPRSCVGRNLANMDLRIFIATVFRRYDVVLENPEVSFFFFRLLLFFFGWLVGFVVAYSIFTFFFINFILFLIRMDGILNYPLFPFL